MSKLRSIRGRTRNTHVTAGVPWLGVALLLSGCTLALGMESIPNDAPDATLTPSKTTAFAGAPVESGAQRETSSSPLGRSTHTAGPISVGAQLLPSSPPLTPRYEVAADESQPEVKSVAVGVVEALTNYDASTDLDAITATVTADADRRAELISAAAPLYEAGMWSRGTVVYPQLGGLRQDSASVMVVVERRLGVGGAAEVTDTRTLDVRLVNDGSGWEFDRLASSGGTPVARPADLAPEAAAVIDDPRIELPDSAVWDIYRGGVSLELLRLMSDLADRTSYGVVVLTSGHPIHVFATDRTSRHTVGRAVDVYRVGAVTVSADRDAGSATLATVEWLYESDRLANMGSPWALDGVGGRSFTDAVHQDHLHLSVSS